MNNKFIKRLRELRGEMSQEEFATIIGAKQTSYSSWERGVKEPSISALSQISSTLGVSADWLLGLSEVREASQNPAPMSVLTKTRQSSRPANAELSFELAAIRRELEHQRQEIAAIKQLNRPTAACCG